ncbi:MAG: tetratricopeptide repeat protein, partial [bacterium]
MPKFKRIASHRLLFFPIFLILIILTFLGCQPKEITTARILVQNENWEQALAVLEEAAGVHPNNAEVHFLLGKAYAARARFEEMKEEFDRSLSISSKFDREISTEIEKNLIKSFNAGMEARHNKNFQLA